MNFYKFYTLMSENTASSKVYWGPYSLVTIEGDLIKVTADDLSEPLYVSRQNNVTNIGNGPINQKLTPSWVKYFEYVRQGDKNIITYAENRAVDCVGYDAAIIGGEGKKGQIVVVNKIAITMVQPADELNSNI